MMRVCNIVCLFVYSLESQIQRSSRPEVLLELSQNSQENTCARVSFLIKLPTTLLKKRLWHTCFPVNFVKFPRILFLTEHLWWLLLQKELKLPTVSGVFATWPSNILSNLRKYFSLGVPQSDTSLVYDHERRLGFCKRYFAPIKKSYVKIFCFCWKSLGIAINSPIPSICTFLTNKYRGAFRTNPHIWEGDLC